MLVQYHDVSEKSGYCDVWQQINYYFHSTPCLLLSTDISLSNQEKEKG